MKHITKFLVRKEDFIEFNYNNYYIKKKEIIFNLNEVTKQSIHLTFELPFK